MHDAASVEALARPFASLLDDRGARRWTPDAPRPPDCLLILTGGTERQALSLWAQRPSQATMLVAHPAHNSLPAALEIHGRLRQLEAPATLCALDGHDDPSGELAWNLQAVSTHRHLQAARLGVVGAPSDWLVASSPSAEVLLDSWGPLMLDIPMEALLERLGPEPSSDAIQAALEDLVRRHRLDAFTLRCFDLLEQRDTTACLALARMGAEGLPAGCEGDIVSATALLWVRSLLGTVPWMANPTRRTGRGLWLAHCSVPLQLVADHRLDSHFESGRGVGVAGRFEPGPVTLLRIGGARMEQLWVAQGSVIEAGSAPDQCRTQAHVALAAADLRALLERPLGNHIVLVPGSHARQLERWWATLGPGRRSWR
jgi:L-fucose isomerase-like protein